MTAEPEATSADPADEREYTDERITSMSRKALATALRHSRRRQQQQGVRLAEWRARAETAEALIALRGITGPEDDGVAAVQAAQAALTAHNERRPDRKLRSDFARWQAKREELIGLHARAVAIHRESKSALAASPSSSPLTPPPVRKDER